MLFNVEYDNGSELEGYLVPDTFSESPSIIVSSDDGRTWLVSCDLPRPAVAQSGRHETGIVGFRVDTNVIPDLAHLEGLTIKDEKSRILIYRRRPAPLVQHLKLLRLHLSLLPFHTFDRACEDLFQYAASSVERFGHETTLQIFHLHNVSSIYLSGRLLLRNYENFLDKGFTAIAEVPEPYYETASKLLVLKGLAHRNFSFVSDRDKILLSPAVDHFSDVNLEDEKQLRRAFKSAGERVVNLFRSPTTRQLICSHPEQLVDRRSVASAIDALSRMQIVGYGANNSHFQDAVGELLGLRPSTLPVMPRQSMLQDLAKRLRAIEILEVWLEEDLIVDHYLREAMGPFVDVNRNAVFLD